MGERLMVDIETLGVHASSVVLSVGLVVFDATSIRREQEFRFDAEQQNKKFGRTIDIQTVMWWQDQSDAAREAAFEGPRLLLVEGLLEMSRFIGDIGDPGQLDVWCKGPSFDFAILKDLYRAAGLPVPWRFWNERDLRTAMEYSDVIEPDLAGNAHCALDDARHQAGYLIMMDRARKIAAPDQPLGGHLQQVAPSGIDVAQTAGRNQ